MYLKIKDNVDLKELEKFEFEYETYRNGEYTFVGFAALGTNHYITIDENDRKITLYIPSIIEICEEVLCTIYKLIKADLVEMVE